MTLQQLRHIKLWFAGHVGNWPLADYEIGELGEGFEDVNKLLGGDTVDKMVGAPMKALQKAVDDKNSAAFTTAFDQLTRRLQQLPPHARPRLHRHPAADVAALQQSEFRAAEVAHCSVQRLVNPLVV